MTTITFEKVSETIMSEKQFLMTVDYDGKEGDIDDSEDLETQVIDLMRNYKKEVSEIMQRYCKQVSNTENVATFDPLTRTITFLTQKMKIQ